MKCLYHGKPNDMILAVFSLGSSSLLNPIRSTSTINIQEMSHLANLSYIIPGLSHLDPVLSNTYFRIFLHGMSDLVTQGMSDLAV